MASEGSEGWIFQINSSPGGVPKRPRSEDRVGPLGLASDKQAHPGIHGGPERALCLYSLERILALQKEGHPIYPGAVGENLTLAGLDWDRMQPGRRLHVDGGVEIELTSYTVPCGSIRAAFADGDSRRIAQTLRPGWSRLYARVIGEGPLRAGQRLRFID